MRLSEAGVYIVNLIDGLDIFKAVYFGDEETIPYAPSCLVEPNTRERQLATTSQGTQNTLSIGVTVLHAKIGDTRITRKECLEQAEQVEDALHDDHTLGGGIVHSIVTSVETGFAERKKTLFVATHLSWTGTDRTRLKG